MSQAQTLYFIRLVEERGVLWNRCHQYYKNLYKLKSAWMEISSILNIPTSRLIQKWKSLSGSYRCYSAKVLQTAGSPANEFKPVWFAYKAMCFLGQMKQRPYIKRNSINETLSNPHVPSLSATATSEEALTDAKDEQPELNSFETLSQQEPLSHQLFEPQPSTSEPVNRKGRTSLLTDFMAHEAEAHELLTNSANSTVAPSRAAQLGLTVSGLVNHFPPEKREHLYKKIIETICNYDTFDEDVVNYGTTIMHLLQNMTESKRKSTYYSIVQLVVKCDTPD